MAKKSRTARSKVAAAQDAETDIGTPELHQRVNTQVHGNGKDRRAKVINKPLEILLAKELISEEQHHAGKQFYEIWRAAGQDARYQSMNIMAIPAGTGDDEGRMMMREKYHEAAKSFRSAEARKTVFNVCCLGESSSFGQMHTRPDSRARAGMRNLRWGLDDLIDHFSRRKPARQIRN